MPCLHHGTNWRERRWRRNHRGRRGMKCIYNAYFCIICLNNKKYCCFSCVPFGFFLEMDSVRFNVRFFSTQKMSNDITKVFLSTVRALRTSAPSPSPTTSASQSVDLEKPRAVEDDFSSRSHALLRELAVVKKHIGTAGTLSIALASTNDPAAQKTYHDLATLISDTLEQCGELLRQLKCISTFDGKKNQRTEEPVKLQLSAHRKSVCRSLDEFLKSLRRSRDEQVRKIIVFCYSKTPTE